MNPCPCGLGYGGAEPQRRACTCSPAQIQKYRAKISGPLLDRIDMQVEVPPPGFQAMSSDAPAWSSERMKRQVEIALRVQAERYRHDPGIRFNSELTGSRLHEVCRLTDAAQKLLQESFEALGLSARAYGRILRLARTIADLEGGGPIDAAHVAEAVQYRCLDRAAPPA
jgi:magnesium chelatase family protein